MGKIYLGQIMILFLFGVFVMLGNLIFVSSAAYAQGCVQTIVNETGLTPGGGYGDTRRTGCQPRTHRGIDIFGEICVPTGHQSNCTLIPNGNSPLHATGGYGMYVRYNCGPRVEVRYAHLNGWGGGQPLNGKTGAAATTPPHIHYEVIVYQPGGSGGLKVDPQCVWGAHPKASRQPNICCQGVSDFNACMNVHRLGSAPANMCDDTVLEMLRQNGLARYNGTSDCGIRTSMNTRAGVPPSSFPPSVPPDTSQPGYSARCQPDNTPHDPDHNHQDEDANVEGPSQNDQIPQPPCGPAGPACGGPNDPNNPPDPPDNPIIPGNPGGPPEIPTLPNSGEYSGCASDTWVAMVNQAMMETRREDIVNKRMIVKADSVLDYGCFQMYVQRTAQDAGPIFSESRIWYNRQVDLMGKTVTMMMWLGSMSLDNALASVVERSLDSYRNRHFNHALVSGTVQVPAGTGQNCDIMNNVWNAAKCKNFDTPWYTFQNLTTTEPREYPPNYVCGGGS